MSPPMSYDFEAELRVTPDFRRRAPRPPLRLALAFRDYPAVETRAEVTPVAGGARGAVRVLVLAQRFFAGRLAPEMVFDCRSGGEGVARGIITSVSNEALRLSPKHHPFSLNLRRYPADIGTYIDAHYGERAALVRQRLQVLLGERPDCRLPSIVRAVLFLGRSAGRSGAFGGALDLDDAEALARGDYRELLREAGEAAARELGGDAGDGGRAWDFSAGFPPSREADA